MQAPNLVQLEGWIHRFRDIGTILRAKGYGREAIRYFQVPMLQKKNLSVIYGFSYTARVFVRLG